MSIALAALVALEFSAMPSADTVQLYKPHNYILSTPQGKSEFHYQQLDPENVEVGQKFPLLLFLHGAGERGSDNQKQLVYLPEWMAKADTRQKYPCFLIAPQCPEGQKWSDVDWSSEGPIALGEITRPMQAVVGILEDAIQNNPIDPRRVYLTGLSMGGYGSWELAERMPDRFAALAPVCGGGDERLAERLVKLPIWAWHGDADQAVPVERSRSMIAAVKAAGGDPKYTELKGVGHDSWTKAYTDPEGVVPWMFQRMKRPDVTTQ